MCTMWQGHNFDHYWKKIFLQDPVVKTDTNTLKQLWQGHNIINNTETKLWDTDTKTLKVKQVPKTLRPGLKILILYGKNFPEYTDHWQSICQRNIHVLNYLRQQLLLLYWELWQPSTARIHRRVASTVQLWSKEFVTREGSGSCLINVFLCCLTNIFVVIAVWWIYLLW